MNRRELMKLAGLAVCGISMPLPKPKLGNKTTVKFTGLNLLRRQLQSFAVHLDKATVEMRLFSNVAEDYTTYSDKAMQQMADGLNKASPDDIVFTFHRDHGSVDAVYRRPTL